MATKIYKRVLPIVIPIGEGGKEGAHESGSR